jgi:hypothetical protein
MRSQRQSNEVNQETSRWVGEIAKASKRYYKINHSNSKQLDRESYQYDKEVGVRFEEERVLLL